MCPSRQDGKEAYERGCMVVKSAGLWPLILCGSSRSFIDVPKNYILIISNLFIFRSSNTVPK